MSHRLGVWAALWECLGRCPACAGLPFMAEGCVMVAPGAKGSFPSITDDATKPKNIIALSNPHTRTTGFQGTRIRMTNLRGRRAAHDYGYYTAKKPDALSHRLAFFSCCACQLGHAREQDSDRQRDPCFLSRCE